MPNYYLLTQPDYRIHKVKGKVVTFSDLKSARAYALSKISSNREMVIAEGKRYNYMDKEIGEVSKNGNGTAFYLSWPTQKRWYLNRNGELGRVYSTDLIY